MMLKPFLTNT